MGFPRSASGKEPACQCRRHEIWVRSLDWEDPLEEGMATHSNILAWRIPWTVEPGGLKSMDSQRVGRNWTDLIHTHTHTHTHRVSISPPSLFSLWMLVNPGLHFGASCLQDFVSKILNSSNTFSWRSHMVWESWFLLLLQICSAHFTQLSEILAF